MNYELKNQLPFVPRYGQVLYISSGTHKRLDDFVRRRTDWLHGAFMRHNLDFCLLPQFIEDSLAYYAPHLSATRRHGKTQQLALSYQAISPDAPILLYSPTGETESGIASPAVYAAPVHAKWSQPLGITFRRLAVELGQEIAKYKKPSHKKPEDFEPDAPEPLHSQSDASTVLVCQEPEEDYGGVRFRLVEDERKKLDTHSQMLVDEIMQRVAELRSRGVSTEFLHDILDDDEPLSRLLITKDFQILLPDYENLEIKMPPLLKAVFLLYLRHPEGIRFKELVDHHDELLRIYRSLQPIGTSVRQQQSIRELTNPQSNSINEKIAQIRKAFVSCFDASLACNYYITGKRGEAKRITLDASMVIWE